MGTFLYCYPVFHHLETQTLFPPNQCPFQSLNLFLMHQIKSFPEYSAMTRLKMYGLWTITTNQVRARIRSGFFKESAQNQRVTHFSEFQQLLKEKEIYFIAE